MRVGIDARLYGVKNRGIGRYIEDLIINLEKIDNENYYYIFLYKNNFNDYQPKNKNFEKILIKIRWYTFAEQFFLPLILKKYHLDLIHYPHFNIPFLGIKKFIVTIHDLTLIHFPNRKASTLPFYLYKLKYWLFRQLQKYLLKKAIIIITPSKFVKKDLLNNYLLPADKIKVIYEGVWQKKYLLSNKILEKLKINKPYLLYVGAAYPHKNLEKLIKVFSLINQKKQHQLIIVGHIDFFMKQLMEKVYQLKEKTIIFTGFLSDNDLYNLYQKAKIFVYPSLSEGFGLPAIEAQANHLPIAASNQTCLKEILGKGAIYFNPYDQEEMLEKIKELLLSKSLKRRVIKAGQINIKRFNWLKMAEETLKLYKYFDQ